MYGFLFPLDNTRHLTEDLIFIISKVLKPNLPLKKKKNILQLNKSGTVKKLPLDLLEEELLPGEHKNS